jgi:hypothetical protein
MDEVTILRQYFIFRLKVDKNFNIKESRGGIKIFMNFSKKKERKHSGNVNKQF